MGSDGFYLRHTKEREKRKKDILELRPNSWLIICEGSKTEPNYFYKAVEDFNKCNLLKSELRVTIKGLGMNTTSLVKKADSLINEVDLFNNKIPLYEKIFVVFDKDDFSNSEFNSAIKMCKENGFIALWSNQSFEYWLLLHFISFEGLLDRKDCIEKLNSELRKKGYLKGYSKIDKNVYDIVTTYGSLECARKNACKIHKNFNGSRISSAKAESCTTVYTFFDELEKRKIN
ncbi:MAG: RloB family protein [Bacilli bacterium]